MDPQLANLDQYFGPGEIMCPLRAYGGYPTLVRHLGLKDMQRFGPDDRKTI